MDLAAELALRLPAFAASLPQLILGSLSFFVLFFFFKEATVPEQNQAAQLFLLFFFFFPLLKILLRRYSHISALCLFICVSAELFSLTFAGQKPSENVRPGQATSVKVLRSQTFIL